ncbi:hypothetical protein PR048_012524, partial [Dryococelus australis]
MPELFSQQLCEFKANKYEEKINSISEESTSRPTSTTVPQKRKLSPATENTQTAKKPFASSHPRAEELTNAVAKMICVDNQPFYVIENQGFARIMNVAEPKYKLPTRKHLSKTVVPEMYEKSHSILFFKASLGKWGLLEKFSDDVWDNACNMSAAMEKAGFKDVSCLAHTLQLVIKDSVFNQKEVSNVIIICRRLVAFCKSQRTTESSPRDSSHATETHDPTRWNSTLHMLKRVLEQRRPLALVTPGQDITPNTASLKENCTLKGMTNDLLASLQRRFSNCKFDQCHATATISDPHFKMKVIVSNEAVIAVKQYILSEMDKLETSKISARSGEMESSNAANFTVSSNSSTNLNSNQKHAMWSMYAKLLGNASSVHQHIVKSEDELETYLYEPIILKKLTKCYLAIPPATVNSDYLFSTAGLISDLKKALDWIQTPFRNLFSCTRLSRQLFSTTDSM